MRGPMTTHGVTKQNIRKIMPTAKRRDFNPTRHRADTNVWTARSWCDKMCISCCSQVQGHQENETNQEAHANSVYAKLLDYTLCCAIWPGRDDSVMNPPDIDDATHGLPELKSENGRLAQKLK